MEDKKHAACDECRTRKLKCSGDNPSCQRCRIEGLRCVYSPRKKMGRPRKRPRADGGLEEFDFNNMDETTDLRPNTGISTNFGIPGTAIPLTNGSSLMGIAGLGNLDPFLVAGLNPVDETPRLDNDPIQQLGQQLEDEMPFQNNNSADLYSFINPGGTSYPTPPDDLSNGDRSCLCLSNMYLTLSNLSTINQFQFPWHIHTLKVALQTSATVLDCPVCPKQPGSAMQNIMMLTTLLSTIVECYRKLLNYIDTESERAAAVGETMHYRIGDSNPEKWHMHTGTADCPMGFNFDLDPPEYKMLATKVVKADVYGTATGETSHTSVLGLVERLEKRQQRWHASEHSVEMKAHYSQGGRECRPEEGDFTCFKLVGMIRNHVELLKL